MKEISAKASKKIKIIGASTITLFSLASVVTGTVAWFTANRSVSIGNNSISVVATGSAELKRLELIKFDYHYDLIGEMKMYDYLNPSAGAVNRYYYNDEYESGAGAFGIDVEDVFTPVDAVMNLYDPVDRIIRGGDLTSLNCNAIYAATFTSDMPNAYLNLFSDLLNNIVPDPEKNEILLSTCIDINAYFPSDLEFCDDTYSNTAIYAVGDFVMYNGILYRCITPVASAEDFDSDKWLRINYFSTSASYPVDSCVFYSGSIYKNIAEVNNESSFSKTKWKLANTYSTMSTYALGDFVICNGRPYICTTAINTGESFVPTKWDALLCHDIYYPSYKDAPYTEDDEIYYKISYISSLETSHANFYSSKPKPSSIPIITNKSMAFADEEDEQIVYVNVNYAPSQADVHTRAIYNPIKALYDFIFNFQFSAFDESDNG